MPQLLLFMLLAPAFAQLTLWDVSLPGGAPQNGLALFPPYSFPGLATVRPLLTTGFDMPALATQLPAGSRIKAVANLPKITALLRLLKRLLETAYSVAAELFDDLGYRVVEVSGPSSADALTILTLQVKLGKAVLAVGLTVEALLEETGLKDVLRGSLYVNGAAAPSPVGATLVAGAGDAFTSDAENVFGGTWLSSVLAAQGLCGACSSSGALAKARVERIKVLLEEMEKVNLLALCSAKEVAETCVRVPPRPQKNAPSRHYGPAAPQKTPPPPPSPPTTHATTSPRSLSAISDILSAFGPGTYTPSVYTASPLGAAAPAPYTALPTWTRTPASALAAFRDALLQESLALLGKFVDQLLVLIAELGYLNAKLQAVTFSGPYSVSY
jgi:hypothetical protein